MTFSNQNSSIITDSLGNLYNFLMSNNEITLIFFDKLMGSVEKKVVAKTCSEEFDSIIDQNDNVYLVYQESEGDVQLLSFIKGMMQTEAINTGLNSLVYNLHVMNDYDDIHVFYCVPEKDKSGQYANFHCKKKSNEWFVEEIGNISINDILNPFSVVKLKDELLLGYFDLVDGVEQLFVKRFNLSEVNWSRGFQLTSSLNKKLYLDMMNFDGDIHCTYCEAFDGNYVVKHDSFSLRKDTPHRVYSHVLSNPSNCTHPTLVKHGNKLWNVWIEHNNVISVYSENQGQGWSEPYLWNESKKDIFSRYKFSSNEVKVNNVYSLNYAFGKQYPNISFLGFGTLNDTTRIPLKKKEDFTKEIKQNEEKKNVCGEEELDEVYSTFYKPKHGNPKPRKNIDKENGYLSDSISDLSKNIRNMQRELDNIKGRVDKLQEAYEAINKSDISHTTHSEGDIENLSNRVEQIENYLRRRRGLFQR